MKKSVPFLLKSRFAALSLNRVRIIISTFLLTGLLSCVSLLDISCGYVEADSQSADNFEIIPSAPFIQHLSEGQKIITPYVQYPRIMLLKNGNPVNQFVLKLEIDDWNQVESNRTIDSRTFQDHEPNPGSGNPFADIDGIAAFVYTTTYPNAGNSPYFSFNFYVEGNPGVSKEFRIGYIVDNEHTALYANDGSRYTHQRDFGKNPPQEVPGDDFGGTTYEDEPSGFYGDNLLDPDAKDLFIELDLPQGDNWLNNQTNRNQIILTLEDVFASADIEAHIFIDFIQGSIPPQALWGDCKDILARERNLQDGNSPPIALGRHALHVVLLRKWGGPIDPGYKLWGQTIQFFGSSINNGVPQGEGRFEYECLKACYDGDALDSVGCVVFWDELIDPANENIYNNNNWTRLEVLCHVIAHEAGHALGIINPEPRMSGPSSLGCIMSEEVFDGYFEPKHINSMEFFQNNIDNLLANDHADAINLKDLLGTHTTSFRTGWFASSP